MCFWSVEPAVRVSTVYCLYGIESSVGAYCCQLYTPDPRGRHMFDALWEMRILSPNDRR